MKWIEECLTSVLNSSIPIEIIVIDNCSSDNTTAYIKTNFKSVILYEQNENLGFGKANNIGMSHALKHNADFVFLLNQDAFVQPDSISKLIDCSINNNQYGILSPIHLDYAGTLLEHSFFVFLSNDKSKTFYSDFVLKNNIKKIYNIDFVQAAAWLLPIATIKKIGGFDPIFFHYGEDNNYSQRVLFHKMEIGVVSNSFIRHDSNTTPKPAFELFSENYFKKYVKKLQTEYANLNIEFSEKQINNEKVKIYKLLGIAFMSFNLFKIKGFYKKLQILSKTVKQIKESRKKNSIKATNYLNEL